MSGVPWLHTPATQLTPCLHSVSPSPPPPPHPCLSSTQQPLKPLLPPHPSCPPPRPLLSLPPGMSGVPEGAPCASIDGDADRVVFFTRRGASFVLLDGDKIASLAGRYLQVGAVPRGKGGGGGADSMCVCPSCQASANTKTPQGITPVSSSLPHGKKGGGAGALSEGQGYHASCCVTHLHLCCLLMSLAAC
jgi:hypothetical protein